MSDPMRSRAMVVVGSGSSTRFGADKLMTTVAGEPLMSHAVRAVSPHVETVVLVCRADQLRAPALSRLHTAEKVAGGASRTQSEIAGLKHLEREYDLDLVGIHDAARPMVPAGLVEAIFAEADRVGGAIPVVQPAMPIIDRDGLRPVDGLMAAQTPQVFRAAELMVAYRQAEVEGFDGHDTAEVVNKYSELEISAVPGDPRNLKITYPEDLATVRLALEERQRRS